MTVIIVICVYLKENFRNLKRIIFKGNTVNQDRDYESEMIQRDIYGGNLPEDIQLNNQQNVDSDD